MDFYRSYVLQIDGIGTVNRNDVFGRQLLQKIFHRPPDKMHRVCQMKLQVDIVGFDVEQIVYLDFDVDVVVFDEDAVVDNGRFGCFCRRSFFPLLF